MFRSNQCWSHTRVGTPYNLFPEANFPALTSNRPRIVLQTSWVRKIGFPEATTYQRGDVCSMSARRDLFYSFARRKAQICFMSALMLRSLYLKYFGSDGVLKFIFPTDLFLRAGPVAVRRRPGPLLVRPGPSRERYTGCSRWLSSRLRPLVRHCPHTTSKPAGGSGGPAAAAAAARPS
jgi:hypothetical protein